MVETAAAMEVGMVETAAAMAVEMVETVAEEGMDSLMAAEWVASPHHRHRLHHRHRHHNLRQAIKTAIVRDNILTIINQTPQEAHIPLPLPPLPPLPSLIVVRVARAMREAAVEATVAQADLVVEMMDKIGDTEALQVAEAEVGAEVVAA